MNSVVSPQLHLIAGQRDGVKVFCSPQAMPVYQQLVKKSQNSNYWADLIVRGIKGLKSGAINSKDVFVKTSKLHKGLQDFTILLPGCTVHANREDNGCYVISRIEATMSYQSQQVQSLKPGLHRAVVVNRSKKWKASFKKDQMVEGKNDHNIVAISDTCYQMPDDAATYTGIRVKGSIKPRVDKDGYDLFFTPGKKRTAGLLNYRQAIAPETSQKLHEPALLLADIMKNAQGVKNITWFSDLGGAAILTQAMQMLATHNITLEGHTIFLHRPTSRKDTAYQLSQKLKMAVEGDFIKSNYMNVNELIGSGSLTLPFIRARNKEDDYGYFKGAIDLGKGVATRGYLKTVSTVFSCTLTA